jgi:hypothetical protein
MLRKKIWCLSIQKLRSVGKPQNAVTNQLHAEGSEANISSASQDLPPPIVTDPDVSLPWSPMPDTCLYPETDQSSPCTCILFFYNPF